MEYNEICPLWIINTQKEDNGLSEKMRHQLLAFSNNEFGNQFEESTSRWWNIITLSKTGDLPIDDKWHPSDIPAYNLPAGHFDVSALTVVVVASLETLNLAIEVVTELRKRQRDGSFMRGSATLVRFYGLLVFNKDSVLTEKLKVMFFGETKNTKSKKKKEPDPLPFDTLFLQGNCNKITANAQDYNYDHLEPQERTDLSVQILFHLALTQGVLSNVGGMPLCVAGAFSMNYESEKWKHLTALSLSEAIFEKFTKNETGEHWHKESEAMYSEEFAKEHEWKCIYGNLKAGFRNIDTTEIVPEAPISPWRLFAKYLIPQYYKKYIKGIVRQIHNNTSAYSFGVINNYHNHVDNQFLKMTQDGVLHHKIESELMSIWDKEKEDGAIGMQQFLSRLDKIMDFMSKQKDSIQELLNQKETDNAAGKFPELSDLPLGNFGDFHARYASYFRSEGTSATKEKNTMGRGKLLKLTRILSFHPVPLSLITRSILTGILLPLVVLTVLNLIPDQLINTSWFESRPGNLVFSIACFILCICWVIFKYHFLVVDNIKQKIKDYVGWCIYQMQVEAYQLTLNKAINYYDNAISICLDVKKRAEAFIDGEKEENSDEQIVFECNKFQTDVMGQCEERDILSKDSICAMVHISVNEYGEEKIITERIDTAEEHADDLHYGVLRRVLMVKNDFLLSILKNVLFGEGENNTPKEQKKTLEADFLHQFVSSISEEISFKIDNLAIHGLSDIVLPHVGQIQRLNKWDGKDHEYSIGDIIRERSYPSAETRSAFHFASVVIPNRANNDDMASWRRLLNLDLLLEDTRYDTIKGACCMSILQGATVSNISQVCDIKI